MNNPTLIQNYTAEAAVEPYRIVKYGTADGQVIHAAASGDAMFGVTTRIGAGSGDRVDVIESGIAEVEYGGNVTRGDLLTSDAQGHAVTAAPAAGANARIIGEAKVSGVVGDIGSVKVVPGRIQG